MQNQNERNTAIAENGKIDITNSLTDKTEEKDDPHNTTEKENHSINENAIQSNIPLNTNSASLPYPNNSNNRDNYTNARNRNINAFDTQPVLNSENESNVINIEHAGFNSFFLTTSQGNNIINYYTTRDRNSTRILINIQNCYDVKTWINHYPTGNSNNRKLIYIILNRKYANSKYY